MTLHLRILGLGVHELVDVGDQFCWAVDQRCPGVQKGLTSTRTSSNIPVHADAETVGKAGIRVMWKAPSQLPLPGCLLNRASCLAMTFPLL